MYAAYPNLPNRPKLTGWEHGFEYIGRATDVIREHANMSYQSFITWDYFTSLYLEKNFIKILTKTKGLFTMSNITLKQLTLFKYVFIWKNKCNAT